jgi:flagellar biosynthesis protein FlhF
MKIKKFVGSNMSECILKVKRELGDDAVILDSRRVARGGPFSFLLTDQVEVIASVDPDRTRSKEHRKLNTENREPKTEPRKPNTEEAIGHRSSVLGDQSAGMTFQILDDLKGLKETVSQITDHLKFKSLPSLPARLEALHGGLLENGVEERVALAITGEMTLSLAGEDFEDEKLLKAALHERVGKIIKVQNPIDKVQNLKSKTRNPRVIALIGPTGVGKTTTLAKMATHPGLYGRQRTALVSADTYRMAAVEQLKTFASIANIPMEAVYRPADMGRAIERFSDREVVLIDTAGRSQNDRGQLADLAAFLDYAQPDEVHLVLSISTRLDDQLDVIAKFSAAGPNLVPPRGRHLIFTKLDETTSFGLMLNVCFHLCQTRMSDLREGDKPSYLSNLPISLLTCGQNVPDDVVLPTASQLVRLCCERDYFKQMTKTSESLHSGP